MNDEPELSWGGLTLALLQTLAMVMSAFILVELYIDNNPMPASFCIIGASTPPANTSLDGME